MYSLFICEWCRIQKLTIFALLVHVLVLGVLANYGLLFSNDLGLSVALTSGYGCFAVVFAALQMRAYSPMGNWLFLINRPLAPRIIFFSLFLVASLFFAITLVIPWLIGTLALDLFSYQVIELRHYLLLAYLFGIALSFYLASALVSLSKSYLTAVLMWLPKGSLHAVLSDRALYLFDGIEVGKGVFPFVPKARIEFMDDYNNLRDVSLVELRDDYLVSFLFGKDERVGAYGAAQVTYQVDGSGTVTLLCRRELERNSNSILCFMPSFISPIGEWITDLAPIHPGRDRYLERRAAVVRWPDPVLLGILALAGLYFVFTYHVAHARNLGKRETWFWAITNGATGIPGIVSFLALTKVAAID